MKIDCLIAPYFHESPDFAGFWPTGNGHESKSHRYSSGLSIMAKIPFTTRRKGVILSAQARLLENVERIDIDRISEIRTVSIHHRVEKSLSQGLRFVERLIYEHCSGLNDFDKLGEVLLTASGQDRVVGIGGLNRDPYFSDPPVGLRLSWGNIARS
jgi:hypothetical protein